MTPDQIKDIAIEAAAKAICIAQGYDPQTLDTIGAISQLPLWKDKLGAAQAAIIAYEAAMIRPIADCPKDGTNILVFDDNTSTPWCEDYWDEKFNDWSVCSDATPSHFRPLPPDPEDLPA